MKFRFLEWFSFLVLFSAGLSFLSWIGSRVEISPSQSTVLWGGFPSVAVAGFPFRAFELPLSPMGSDYVPESMMSGLYANTMVWIGVGLGLATLFIWWFPEVSQKYKRFALVAGVVLVLSHKILFLFWFD